jgi:hypothetical protein
MEEQPTLRTPQRNNPLGTRAREAVRFGATPDAGAAEEEDGAVEIIWGANMDSVDVAGMTVAEVRAHLAGAYNIAPEATVHVNGVEAGEDTRLRAGDCLEFVRAAGEKGGV